MRVRFEENVTARDELVLSEEEEEEFIFHIITNNM